MKYKVTLNGKTYEVEVEKGEAILVDEYAAYAPAPAPVTAPVPVAAPAPAAPVTAAPTPVAAPAALTCRWRSCRFSHAWNYSKHKGLPGTNCQKRTDPLDS